MGWYVIVETQTREVDREYSSYDDPQRALEDGLRKMSSKLVGKELREVTLTKS